MAHPYSRYESSTEWRVLDQALDTLVANGDLEEKTARSHIVGYLCQALESSERRAVGERSSGS